MIFVKLMVTFDSNIFVYNIFVYATLHLHYKQKNRHQTKIIIDLSQHARQYNAVLRMASQVTAIEKLSFQSPFE